MREHSIIVFMYRVGYPILEEWVSGEVGEVVIATVQWWAALSHLWNMWLCTCLLAKD